MMRKAHRWRGVSARRGRAAAGLVFPGRGNAAKASSPDRQARKKKHRPENCLVLIRLP